MGKKPRVLVMSGTFETEAAALEALRNEDLDFDVIPLPERKTWSEETYANALKGYDGLVAGADFPITPAILNTGIKAVSLNCTGVDHVSMAYATSKGIPVYNTPGLSYNACADLIMGLTLSLMRRIVQGDKAIRNGLWNKGCERSPSVSGKTMSIIGLGSIGLAVCKRAIGFDINVLANVRHPKPELAKEYGFTYVDRDEALSKADILVICCPLSEETRGIIDAIAISKMKKGSVIINASRGPIINTPSLIEALSSGHLFGAALDVYDEEPLYESPLFNLENVVLTPHLAGLADKQIEACAVKAAENMSAFFKGTKPYSIVNPEALINKEENS